MEPVTTPTVLVSIRPPSLGRALKTCLPIPPKCPASQAKCPGWTEGQ